MRQICSFFAAFLLFAAVAAAQGPAGAGSGSIPGSRPGSNPRSRTSSLSPAEFSQWQIAVGYEYNRINLLGEPFSTDGINATVTRFFGRWFGVDGQLGTGFLGNTGSTTTPPNLGVHSLFVGGGPRLALRGHSRFEPWVHAAAGLEEFRFTQTAGVLGSNNGFGVTAGGGVDYILGQHLALRGEADIIETDLFSTYQRHFQAVGGFVINF